jgi:MFS family permease
LIAPRAGALVDRLGERPLVVGGLALQAVGMACMALIAAPERSYLDLALPMTVAGCGFSMSLPAVTKAVVSSVAPPDIGKASGTFTMMRQLGGAFGVAILVAVFAAAGSYASPNAFSTGFTRAIGVAAGLAFAGAVASLALPRRSRASGTQPSVPGDVSETTREVLELTL